MTPETVAVIVAAVVAGLLTLAGVWLSDRAATRREDSAYRRTATRESAEQLTSLFARALIILDRHARNYGAASEGDLSDMLEVKVRLELQANTHVVAQFEKAARILDEWAAEARQGSPRPGPGGITIFSAGTGEKKHNERSAELWPLFAVERERLTIAMRSSLTRADE